MRKTKRKARNVLASRTNRIPLPAYFYTVQLLEERRLLSNISWTGGANDQDFFSDANWAGGHHPTANDVAVFTSSPAGLLTFNPPGALGQASLGGIVVNPDANVVIALVDATVSMSSLDIEGGTLTLNGGGLPAAMCHLSISSSIYVATEFNGGELDFGGNINVAANGLQIGTGSDGTLNIGSDADVTTDSYDVVFGSDFDWNGPIATLDISGQLETCHRNNNGIGVSGETYLLGGSSVAIENGGSWVGFDLVRQNAYGNQTQHLNPKAGAVFQMFNRGAGRAGDLGLGPALIYGSGTFVADVDGGIGPIAGGDYNDIAYGGSLAAMASYSDPMGTLTISGNLGPDPNMSETNGMLAFEPEGSFASMNSSEYDGGDAYGNTIVAVMDSEGDSSRIAVTGTVYVGGNLADSLYVQQAEFDLNNDSWVDGHHPLNDIPYGTSCLLVMAGDVQGGYADYNFGDVITPSSYPGLYAAISSHLPQLSDGEYWAVEDLSYMGGRALVLTTTDANGSYLHSSGYYGSSMMFTRGGNALAGSSTTSALAAPSDPFAAQISTYGIHIGWTNSNPDDTAYEIQRQTDDGSWVTVHTAYSSLVGWFDKDVQAGHTYDYRIRAIDENDPTNDSDFAEIADAIDF